MEYFVGAWDGTGWAEREANAMKSRAQAENWNFMIPRWQTQK
jgi:hypothetical protein